MRLALTDGSLQASAASVPRLRIAVLDHAPGVGIFAAGWLADPAGSISKIMMATDAGEPAVDLLRDGSVPITEDLFAAFGAPPEATLTRGFFVHLPDMSSVWAGRARIEVRYADGSFEHCTVPATGHFFDIGRVFETAPIEHALVFAERLFARRDSTFGGAIPPPIEMWMAALYRRMSALPGIKAAVKEVIRVENCGMMLRLSLPAGDELAGMTLVSFGGRRVMLETPLPMIMAGQSAREADDVCAIFAATPGLRPDEEFWFVEATFTGGRTERVPLRCPASPPPSRGIEAVLALMDPLPRDPEGLLDRAVAPAVAKFWKAARSTGRAGAQAVYGCVTDAPRVSVVISLGDQADQIRHQVAQFSNDPEFRSGSDLELIYVMDDRSVDARTFQTLNDIYDVPFRTIVLDGSCGSLNGSGVGAAAATGSVFVFLGAAVLPKRAGWVGELLRCYRVLDNCGVLGCRLLAEDGSLRHSGVTFRQASATPGGWEEHYPWVGLPTNFDPARKPCSVPAVSGACLMIEVDLFKRLGSFSDEYVYGSFADFDLCFAARQAGKRVYYTPEVELYQFDNPQTVAETRLQAQVDLHNRWKCSRKWANLLARLLAQFGG